MNSPDIHGEATSRRESSTDRVLSLLDLFTAETPVWTVEALMKQQGLARATMYRHVKALVSSGFLTPLGSRGYGLGPRFVEIDHLIRQTDPVLHEGRLVMDRIREEVGGAQLLCRYYGSRVLTIHQDRLDERIQMSMERGRPFSLFLGSPSRIILASLPMPQLQKLFLYHADEIAAAGLGRSWVEFREGMRAIRKAGVAIASDIDTSLVGISAPIHAEPDVVTASLCLVRVKAEVTPADYERLSHLAIQAASEISRRLQLGTSGLADAATEPRPADRDAQPRRASAAGRAPRRSGGA